MTKLSSASQIWQLTPTKEDLLAGARYAQLTLPWTFNRMMAAVSANGQNSRALNIAKGVVGQEMLRRELSRRGVAAPTQQKSHRDDDLFDFNIAIDGRKSLLDVKTVNYYTDYQPLGRAPLSRQLIIDQGGYDGPDWRQFLPMLMAHTQIGQKKEFYCFSIVSSIDFRTDIDTDRVGKVIAAFPYGEALQFLSSKRLCREREQANQGFYVECSLRGGGFFTEAITLTIIGEWAGEVKEEIIKLQPGRQVSAGPFAVIASFQLNNADYGIMGKQELIEIKVTQSDFNSPVLNATKRDINVPPSTALVLHKSDFCNLVLPSSYNMYVVGWISKEEMLQACRKYKGWVWPYDKVDKYLNQPWSQITDNDRSSITRAGFGDVLDAGRPLQAGWLKTSGKGPGACCYFYPNIGSGGGVKETNLYVLPQDLDIMDELGR